MTVNTTAVVVAASAGLLALSIGIATLAVKGRGGPAVSTEKLATRAKPEEEKTKSDEKPRPDDESRGKAEDAAKAKAKRDDEKRQADEKARREAYARTQPKTMWNFLHIQSGESDVVEQMARLVNAELPASEERGATQAERRVPDSPSPITLNLPGVMAGWRVEEIGRWDQADLGVIQQPQPNGGLRIAVKGPEGPTRPHEYPLLDFEPGDGHLRVKRPEEVCVLTRQLSGMAWVRMSYEDRANYAQEKQCLYVVLRPLTGDMQLERKAEVPANRSPRALGPISPPSRPRAQGKAHVPRLFAELMHDKPLDWAKSIKDEAGYEAQVEARMDDNNELTVDLLYAYPPGDADKAAREASFGRFAKPIEATREGKVVASFALRPPPVAATAAAPIGAQGKAPGPAKAQERWEVLIEEGRDGLDGLLSTAAEDKIEMPWLTSGWRMEEIGSWEAGDLGIKQMRRDPGLEIVGKSLGTGDDMSLVEIVPRAGEMLFTRKAPNWDYDAQVKPWLSRIGWVKLAHETTGETAWVLTKALRSGMNYDESQSNRTSSRSYSRHSGYSYVKRKAAWKSSVHALFAQVSRENKLEYPPSLTDKSGVAAQLAHSWAGNDLTVSLTYDDPETSSDAVSKQAEAQFGRKLRQAEEQQRALREALSKTTLSPSRPSRDRSTNEQQNRLALELQKVDADVERIRRAMREATERGRSKQGESFGRFPKPVEVKLQDKTVAVLELKPPPLTPKR